MLPLGLLCDGEVGEMPCVVVAIAMRQEFGGWRWFGVAFAYQTALAWGMALLVHQGGRLLGFGG